LEPGVARLVRWRAIFTDCVPGKHTLSIEYGCQIEWDQLGGGFDGYFDKKIFISTTTKDEEAGTYFCQVPEGRLGVKFLKKSFIAGWKYDDLRDGTSYRKVIVPPTGVLEEFVGNLTPSVGSEDTIPFNDPWWKVIAWLVAVLAIIAAYLAAKEGKGTASIGISGDYADDANPDIDWCAPDPTNHSNYENLAGYLSILATTAIRVGMMDSRDPWQKGRDKFPQAVLDPRESESLHVTIDPPSKLVAGSEYYVPIEWKYVSTTKNKIRQLEQRTELGKSDNIANNVRVMVPVTVPLNQDIVVQIYLEDKNNIPLAGDALYGHVYFTAPNKKSFKVTLANVEMTTGRCLSIGNFQARLNTENVSGIIGPENTRGDWVIEIYAQNVNDASAKLSAFEAATIVGGDFLLGPISATKNTSIDDNTSEKCEPDKTLRTKVV
tara:strand:+ start:756 stop:2060 length:1305 start_codon:yes stop_codon:yes gene_type:complete